MYIETIYVKMLNINTIVSNFMTKTLRIEVSCICICNFGTPFFDMTTVWQRFSQWPTRYCLGNIIGQNRLKVNVSKYYIYRCIFLMNGHFWDLRLVLQYFKLDPLCDSLVIFTFILMNFPSARSQSFRRRSWFS
jgi:hypothetical protein